MPYRGLLGSILYLGVYGFNVYMTFAIQEYLLGLVDLLLFLPICVFAILHVLRPIHRATPADLEAHCRDFPFSPLTRLRTAPRPVRLETEINVIPPG